MAVFPGLVTDIAAAALTGGVTPSLAAADRGNIDGPIVTLDGAISGRYPLRQGLPGRRRLGGIPTGRRIGVKGRPGVSRGRYRRPRPGAQGAVRRNRHAIAVGEKFHTVNNHRLIAAAFLFLPGKLKNGGDGLAGNPRFPLGQPALLGGDKAAKRAAFPPIDRVIPLVAVFPGGPGFGFGKGIGLVKAAVEGFAPVFGQGFQNGGVAVGMGKGLPVGTVPGRIPGKGIGCPPPLLQRLRLTRQ